jgi:hypothetical protein
MLLPACFSCFTTGFTYALLTYACIERAHAVACFLMLFLLYYRLYLCFTYLCLYRARACLPHAFLALLQALLMLYLLMLVSSARMLLPASSCFSCFTTGFTYALLLYIGRACCRLGSSSASRSRASCTALCLMPYALCLMPYAFRARMLSPGEQQRLSFARLLYRGDSDKVQKTYLFASIKVQILTQLCWCKSANTNAKAAQFLSLPAAVLVQKCKY